METWFDRKSPTTRSFRRSNQREGRKSRRRSCGNAWSARTCPFDANIGVAVEPTSKAERINQFTERQSDASDRAGPPIRRRSAHARSSRSSIHLEASASVGERLRRSAERRKRRKPARIVARANVVFPSFGTKTSRSIRRDRDAITPINGGRLTRCTSRSPLIASASTYEEFFIREFRGFIDRGSSGSVTRSVNPGRNARTIRVIRITLQPIYVLRGSLDEYRV